MRLLFKGSDYLRMASNGRSTVCLVFCHLCAQKGCLSYKQGPGEQSQQNQTKFCLIPPKMLVVFHNP